MELEVHPLAKCDAQLDYMMGLIKLRQAELKECSKAVLVTKVDSQHVEAQLSHVKEGVRGVYDKSTYLEQRKVMMQWYANYLDGL